MLLWKKSARCDLRSVLLPWAALCVKQMHGGLNELKGSGIPQPDDLEPRLLTFVLDPKKVTRTHLATNARQQSATSANACSNDLLGEALPGLVSAVDSYDEAFIFSKLTALFHQIQRGLAGVDLAQIFMPKIGEGLAERQSNED